MNCLVGFKHNQRKNIYHKNNSHFYIFVDNIFLKSFILFQYGINVKLILAYGLKGLRITECKKILFNLKFLNKFLLCLVY